MQVIIILSENVDFVDSLKQALAYTNQETLKFQFLSDIDGLRHYISLYGQPELLLCDRKLQPKEHQLSHTFPIGILTESQMTSRGEVFIYQNMESFIKEVNKMVVSENKQTLNHAASSASAVWLLDPCEGSWTKQCFGFLADHYYTQSQKTLCVDASVFGCSVPNLRQIQTSSLSEHIAGFLWGKEAGTQESQADFHYMGSVKHPVDLLAVDPLYWDTAFGELAMPYSNRLLYSGLYSEAHLKKMVRHFSKLVIATQESTISMNQLQQLQVWFNQIEPRLEVKVYHALNSQASPEQFAGQIIQGAY